MKRVDKRHVTLLELLIAIGLTAILLSALLGYYQQASYARIHIAHKQEENFELLYAQYRLNRIMPTILNPIKKESSKLGVYFYTKSAEPPKEKSDSLIFAYDNGTGGGQLFSNEVLAKLFVDSQGQLILLTWPIPKNFDDPDAPMRKEVLLTNAEDVKFSLYKPIPKDKKGLQIDPERETGEYDQWFSEWPIEEKELPALIKIKVKIKDKDKPVVYAFMLSGSEDYIYYP
jgi:type II secretory pathway component PulJ